jgi:ATP-dependent exoDNAse (exonuclease V) beta subunit
MTEPDQAPRLTHDVEDQAVRDDALDISRSFIVRAPAGSGKTRLLIQRYLALLANVDEPEEIVAITFTRKAAAEMRERVLAAFATAGSEIATSDETTRRLAIAALERDSARGWQLAANASRLRIQTIDALNASLTRQMPLASRFGAQPESVDDATALYDEAARALLAEIETPGPVADDLATLLVHLDNNLNGVRNLIAQMLRSRDHWLRSLPRMHEREALEAALKRARLAVVLDLAARFPEAEIDETLAMAAFAGPKCPESRANAGVLPLASLTQWPAKDESSVPAWLAICDFLLTQGGTWRKRGGLNKNGGFPPGESKVEKAEFAAAKDRMGALLERLSVHPHSDQLVAAFVRLRGLPPGEYSEQQWAVLGAIVRLLPIATGFLWTVFGAHGQCDFTEISQSAVRALGTDEAPSDLALALDYRIRHLLVDEFQDTSFAQFELLEKLTRGWAPGDGCSMLVVGDPMQSIYRFREAEVGLFVQAMNHGIGGVHLHPLNLRVNFRSVPGLVEWVNDCFGRLMPAEEDAVSGRVPFAPGVAHSRSPAGASAAVQWHPQFVARGDAVGEEDAAVVPGPVEAQQVVEIVTRTRSERPAAEIALLVRNRSHLLDIVPALQAAGIAFQAVDIDPLQDRPVVQDMLSLVRALLHPADRIAWLALLRAPWCGLAINDLAALLDSAQTHDGVLQSDPRAVWDIMADEQRLATLSETGRECLLRLRAVLAPALADQRRLPLRELLERVWLALAGPACLDDPASVEDAEVLLDLIESEADAQTGGSHIIDIDLLMSGVRKLFAGNRVDVLPGQPPPLKIMTIHKAKGLEFDTVIVPGLHRAPRGDDRKLLVWTEQTHTTNDNRKLLIAPIRETGAPDDADAIYRYVRQLDRGKQQQEDIRLLYVAATRAERSLHLLATISLTDGEDGMALATPRPMSLLAAIWPVAETAIARAASAREAAQVPMAAAGNCKLVAMRLSDRFVLPVLPAAVGAGGRPEAPFPSAAVDFEWAGDTARHVGTVVHGFLQRIAEQGLVGWSDARIPAASGHIERELQQLGVAVDEVPAAAARVTAALKSTLADERGRWILGTHESARAEWRITGTVGGQLVNVAVDRTFVDESGVRWIIDFKTGGHEGGNVAAFLDNERERYRRQLEVYATLISKLPAKTYPPAAAIRLALYFPLLSGWREWQWEPGPAA